MSKIKNGRLDQYGAEPFEQQQSGTAGVEMVKPVAGFRARVNHFNVTVRPSRRVNDE